VLNFTANIYENILYPQNVCSNWEAGVGGLKTQKDFI